MRTEAKTFQRPGIYERFAKVPQTANAEITDQERKKITSERNAPPYIADLLRPDHPRSVNNRRLEGQGVVQTMWQLQPWEWGAAMVTVGTADIADGTVQPDKQGRVPVQFVYEKAYSPELQKEYAKGILGLMSAMSETKLPGEQSIPGLPPVVAMENVVGELGDGRTLALPHVVVNKTGMEVDTTNKPHFAKNLLLEQRLKRMYSGGDEYVGAVEAGMREDLGEFADELTFYKRLDAKPVGYTIGTQITPEGDMDRNAAVFAAVTRSHYFVAGEVQGKAYSTFNGVAERIAQRGMVEPYAYRQSYYFLPDENGQQRLHLTFSPVLLKKSGAAKEDSGGMLKRGPQFARPYSDAAERRYESAVKQKLAAIQ